MENIVEASSTSQSLAAQVERDTEALLTRIDARLAHFDRLLADPLRLWWVRNAATAVAQLERRRGSRRPA